MKTSQTFSLFETGEKLHRGDEPSPTRSSVLVRLGHSHVRFGTFQRLAHVTRDVRAAGLAKLVDYSRSHLPPRAPASRAPRRPRRRVPRSRRLRERTLAARVDDGGLRPRRPQHRQHDDHRRELRLRAVPVPPTFDPDFVAAYFDHGALCVRPAARDGAAGTSSRLADALRTLVPSAPLGAPIAAFDDRYEEALTGRTLVRLGVEPRDPDSDRALAMATWSFLESSKIGFEQLFFDLYGGVARAGRALAGPAADFYEGTRWTSLRDLLMLYEPQPRSAKALGDPYFQCDSPTTLLIDEIEAIWTMIATKDDWAPLHAKVAEIRAMGAAIRRTGGPNLPATCSASSQPSGGRRCRRSSSAGDVRPQQRSRARRRTGSRRLWRSAVAGARRVHREDEKCIDKMPAAAH